MFAKPFIAPAVELQQRKRISRSAAKIENPGFRLATIIHLFEQQRHQIARVQHITRLMAVTAETNEFERATAQAGVNPKTDDALIGSSKLSCARQQAAAVDPNRQAKCLTIFKRKKFRSHFTGTVEGKWWHGGKLFGHAPCRNSLGQRLVEIECKCSVVHQHRQASQGWNGVNPARTQ